MACNPRARSAAKARTKRRNTYHRLPLPGCLNDLAPRREQIVSFGARCHAFLLEISILWRAPSRLRGLYAFNRISASRNGFVIFPTYATSLSGSTLCRTRRDHLARQARETMRRNRGTLLRLAREVSWRSIDGTARAIGTSMRQIGACQANRRDPPRTRRFKRGPLASPPQAQRTGSSSITTPR